VKNLTPNLSEIAVKLEPAYVATLKLVLIYAVFASLWIAVSDDAVLALFSDPEDIHLASTIKGWLFVGVTSGLLFGLVYRQLAQAREVALQRQAAETEQYRIWQLLDAVVNSSSDAIFAKDTSGRYLLANRETLRLLGKPAVDVIGQTDDALFPPPQAAVVRANDQRVMEENQVITYEESVATADGYRIYLATKGPLHDLEGKLFGLFGISRDITERTDNARDLQQKAEALQLRNEELDRFNRATVGRELVLIGLKRQVNELSLQLGRAPPYDLSFAAESPPPATASMPAPPGTGR